MSDTADHPSGGLLIPPDMDHQTQSSPSPGRIPQHTGAPKWIPAVLIVGGLAIGWWIYRSGPATRPELQHRPPKIVTTVAVEPSVHNITVTAYGSVIPARRVVIEPQVSGYVIRQHRSLIPGGYVKQGDELFAIDPKLTELNLREARAEVARAEAALQEGTRKWQEGRRLASQEIIPDTELAALESARRILESDLERLRAAQDRELELLERHVIRAPFNSIVLEETVELGQRLAPGDVALTLVGTDEFWVRASVSTDKLRWVNVPSPERSGSAVDVYLDIGEGELARYHGQVIELLSDLEEVGRMARVLISVPDPLQLSHSANPHPLLLGSYVRVEIAAGELRNVLALDRSALREGNRLWIVDANNRLQIRNAKVLWRQEDRVYLEAALGPAETVVVSDLRVALPDTEVRAQPAVEDSARDAAVQVIQP